MRKYFGYCRSATREQGQTLNSLDKQEKAILGYAKDNNIDVIKIFKEYGSGIDSNRPSYKEMIGRLECGESNGIICTSIDRITRDYYTFAQLMKLIDERDIEIVTPERTYRKTKEDQLALSVMVAFAEFYAKSLAERVKRAKLQTGKQDR